MSEIKLQFEDMEVSIVRTYRLADPVPVEPKPGSGDYVLAEQLQTITRQWTKAEHETTYQVYGRTLKKDGTPDQRQGSAWHRLWKPSFEKLPDPRQPFLDALDALGDNP